MGAVRHHFVPQGFLRGFAVEGNESKSFVWVYDKTPGKAPRKKSVRSVAWAPAYYAQENDDGTVDLDTIETALAKNIDNEIPIILRTISPKPDHLVELGEKQREALAFFIGLSLTRVPSFRDGINAMYTQLAQRSLDISAASDLALAQAINRYGIKAQANPWVSLRPMVKVAKQVAEGALAKNWQFCIAPPSVPLVTSDNPVLFSGSVIGLKQIGPAHPSCELVINLRKDLALVCTPKKGYPSMQAFAMTPFDARRFNRGIVQAAHQRVFANHESVEIDGIVKKYAHLEQKFVV